MKGLYFLEIDLRKKSLYYECMLTNFHLDVQISHRMFKGYAELEELYINVLQNCKINTELMDLVYGL
jgi:predicted RNA-binding protein associated with RNAse of E/G family